jgi:ferredoxin
MTANADLPATSHTPPLLRPDGTILAAALRELCRRCGADDVGFVAVDDPRVAGEQDSIRRAFPNARSLIAVCQRMQVENVRSPMRSVANQAFHTTGHEVDETCRRIVLALEERGIRAGNPSMAFPMELADPDDVRPWIVSHKVVAEAAGLGRIGLHRSVIHPRFGSFVLLGTIVVDAAIDALGETLAYQPCLDCKLCVAACPVGAIAADGHFDASACMTHNYRDFLGGFSDWVERIADARDSRAYRRSVDDGETLSMWQSLAFGPNYRAANCLAVCPAGSDVLGTFHDRPAVHVQQVLKPLQKKQEPLYVVPGSDAETFASKRYPHKPLRRVHQGLRARSIDGFLRALPWLFQRGRSEGLRARYHFDFRGRQARQATVLITEQRIEVLSGLVGEPDVRLVADGEAWLRFVGRDRSLLRLLVTGALRLRPFARGLRLLARFGRCFPS